MTSRHLLVTVAGLTQASSVMPVERWRAAASGTLTRVLEPLNDTAPPNLPELLHFALTSLPVLLLPEASAVVVPDPSSNAYAATSPGGPAGPGLGMIARRS